MMADDFEGGKVDLLIGIDHVYRVVLRGQLEIGRSLGPLRPSLATSSTGMSVTVQSSLDTRHFHCRQVEQMWNLDTIGVGQKEAIDDVGAQPTPQWNQQEGCYEMRLIWNSEDRPVSNRSATKARTSRMSERLSEEKARLYDEQIRTMVKDGVVEQAVTASNDDSNADGQNGAGPPSGRGESWADARSPGLKSASPASDEFCLPHHGISRNGKLRIVFDGSAKEGVGQSLNEYLGPGKNLLVKLPSVLLNFRSGAVGCQAEIQAAFHQVLVDKEDRKYLQFFWAESFLRFVRVPFGLTCSPYMLLKTVETHLSHYIDRDPELCQLIHDSCYMDDLCLHFHDREEAATGLARTRDIF